MCVHITHFALTFHSQRLRMMCSHNFSIENGSHPECEVVPAQTPRMNPIIIMNKNKANPSYCMPISCYNMLLLHSYGHMIAMRVLTLALNILS